MYNPNVIRTDPMQRSGSRKRKKQPPYGGKEKWNWYSCYLLRPGGAGVATYNQKIEGEQQKEAPQLPENRIRNE